MRMMSALIIIPFGGIGVVNDTRQLRMLRAASSPVWKERALNLSIDMLAMSSQQSRSQIQARFGAVNDLLMALDDVDEVHHSMWCSLDVPHLARLCRGWPRPCSRRLPCGRRSFRFSGQNIELSIRTYV